MILLITLPHPPSQLSPNARLHWRPKMAFVKKARADARVATQAAMRETGCKGKFISATVKATFHRKRRMDGDNLAAMLKSCWDGMVDAGLFTDDRRLTHLPIEQVIDGKLKRQWVVVEVS